MMVYYFVTSIVHLNRTPIDHDKPALAWQVPTDNFWRATNQKKSQPNQHRLSVECLDPIPRGCQGFPRGPVAHLEELATPLAVGALSLPMSGCPTPPEREKRCGQVQNQSCGTCKHLPRGRPVMVRQFTKWVKSKCRDSKTLCSFICSWNVHPKCHEPRRLIVPSSLEEPSFTVQ